MIVTLMKNNLPWIAPSVAIALAATGFFDRGDNADVQTSAAVQTSPAYVQPQVEPLQTVPVPSQQPMANANEVSQTSNLATSLNSLSATGVLNDQAALGQTQPTPVVAIAPEPDVSAVQAEPTLSDDPAGFLAAAKANLAGQTSCVEDLRNLTSHAWVYFPSGGLAGEERGMGQARLIGLVAQDCPGIQIRVEGHSDRSGDPQVNLSLSLQRAESIIARIASAGIDTSNFFAKGYGQQKPSTVRGPRPTSYYDRRVEFELIENTKTASLSELAPTRRWATAACVADLEASVRNTKIFFAPRSITSSTSDFSTALQLAVKAAACPQARLRVVGQHSDDLGSGETVATGRLRAISIMSALVGEGIDASQIIIGAPSWSQPVAGQPGLSNSRIDFDVIYEDG